MLTVSGIVVVPPDGEIRQFSTEYVTLVSFIGIMKNPYKSGTRGYVKVEICVSKDKRDNFIEKLTPGKAVWIRLGELYGIQTDKGTVFNVVKVKYNHVEFIKGTLTPDRSSENIIVEPEENKIETQGD